MVVAPAINTGTYAVAPQDAGVASATVTVGQQLGASIGTSLLNTIFATAVASYVVAHGSTSIDQALPHGYDTAFWWTCGIAAGGAIVCALLLRPGPLVGRSPVTSLSSRRVGKV
jgi:mannitol-specific phosphotransferase system IIBC component